MKKQLQNDILVNNILELREDVKIDKSLYEYITQQLCGILNSHEDIKPLKIFGKEIISSETIKHNRIYKELDILLDYIHYVIRTE